MKYKTSLYLLAVLTILFAVLLSFAPVAHAQDAQPTAGSDAALAAPFIVNLAQSHPWVLTLVSIMGALRFFFKPLVSLVEAWVKSTPSPTDDEFVEKVEASKAWKTIAWLIDLLASIKFGPQFTAKPSTSDKG